MQQQPGNTAEHSQKEEKPEIFPESRKKFIDKRIYYNLPIAYKRQTGVNISTTKSVAGFDALYQRGVSL